MRVKRSDNERLIIVHFPFFFLLLAILPSVVLGLVAADVRNGDKLPGLVTSLAFCLFYILWGGLFFYLAQFVRFDFDLQHRELIWSRRNLFRKQGGTVPFAQIQYAVIGISGDSYRPELIVSNIGSIPLLNYHHGAESTGRDYMRIIATINAALLVSSTSPKEVEILEKINQRLLPNALELVCKRYGFDLPTANFFMDEMQKRISACGVVDNHFME